ncbi:hypothetical protein F5878DRAFT_328492 [Lentinula raphanica]|uniref:Uncharacterized protein n=1 Tax=Lentinula raphanica TaxID=153919 RepID=A0AA38P2S6_9AGAR|nr:hypothetical protein F5878DRAFT_328492 [Lentinula raphanica]
MVGTQNSAIVLLGFAWVFDCISALPQQASVSLYEFLSVAPGSNPTAVVGIEWAQPIGTASDGSRTTFIVENVFPTSVLVSSGATELTALSVTGIETVVVSASGWAESNAAGSTQLGGGLDCHFTASDSGECVEEEVLNDGSTSTRTLTGDVITQVLPISTGTLPSGVGVTTSNQQSTITAVTTTSSVSQSTITALSSTSSTASGSATPTTSASNGSLALSNQLSITEVLAGLIGGMMLFTSVIL